MCDVPNRQGQALSMWKQAFAQYGDAYWQEDDDDNIIILAEITTLDFILNNCLMSKTISDNRDHGNYKWPETSVCYKNTIIRDFRSEMIFSLPINVIFLLEK